MPQISVIMGIYNCADTLPEAIDCILAQTVTDWELILCDDGSADDTAAVAEDYCRAYPEKIRLLRNEHNLGLNKTLNRCLQEARGIYIARMDGDDLCSPERFARELAVLEENPDIAFVSTDMTFFDGDGTWGRTHTLEAPEAADLLRETQFCHAPCMVRRQAFLAVGGYSEETRLLRVEDYHLWVKMYEKGFRGRNIREPLYGMRDDRNAQKRKRFRYRFNEAYVKAYAVKHLGLPVSGYLYCLKPIAVGLMPGWLYRRLHRIARPVENGETQ